MFRVRNALLLPEGVRRIQKRPRTMAKPATTQMIESGAVTTSSNLVPVVSPKPLLPISTFDLNELKEFNAGDQGSQPAPSPVEPNAVRYSEYEKELKSKEFKEIHSKILSALSSPLDPFDQCLMLSTLHDIAVAGNFHLPTWTYEAIFHTFSTTLIHHQQKQRAKDGFIYQASVPFLNDVWRMYQYMLSFQVPPTLRIFGYIMAMLERKTEANSDIEAKAHALMLDLDRSRFPPHQVILCNYFRICAKNNCMHLALARYWDAITRWQSIPTDGMACTIMMGLTHNKHIEEGLAFIRTLHQVPMTQYLMNSILNFLRYTSDPLSSFSVYESLKPSRVVPVFHTMTILLECCFAANNFDFTPLIVKEMAKYQIKGDVPFLNKLLEGLLRGGKRDEFQQLRAAMLRRSMRVFDHESMLNLTTNKEIPTASHTLIPPPAEENL